MDKQLIYDYMEAKRGRKTMSLVLTRVIGENEALNKKFLKLTEENTSLTVIAKKLDEQGIVVEMLAKANGFSFIYTTTDTYIQK